MNGGRKDGTRVGWGLGPGGNETRIGNSVLYLVPDTSNRYQVLVIPGTW